jgi:hypothetical protein
VRDYWRIARAGQTFGGGLADVKVIADMLGLMHSDHVEYLDSISMHRQDSEVVYGGAEGLPRIVAFLAG